MNEAETILPRPSICADIFHTVYFIRALEESPAQKRTSYFIRINTKGMQPFFSADTAPSDINMAGEIVKMHWMQIPSSFPGVKLDTFTVNAGSVQGIVSIIRETRANRDIISEAEEIFNFPPPKLLLEAFSHFKNNCTKSIKMSMPDMQFGWQPLFTSLLISNSTNLSSFRDYIQNK